MSTSVEGSKERIWEGFCKGTGLIVLGTAGYYASNWGSLFSVHLPGIMMLGGLGSMGYGMSFYNEAFWSAKEKVEVYVGGVQQWITGYNMRSDKVIAAVLLSGSLPNVLNSPYMDFLAFVSGGYLLYNTEAMSFQEAAARVANPGNFYTRDDPLHVDYNFESKLKKLPFYCTSVGAAYLANQVKPEYATASNLHGKTVSDIQRFLLNHPNVQKDAWKSPSDSLKHASIMALLNDKFAIVTSSARMTRAQRECRAALLATNGKDFRHPPIHGFNSDQMNAFLKECYNTAVEEEAARAQVRAAHFGGRDSGGVEMPN